MKVALTSRSPGTLEIGLPMPLAKLVPLLNAVNATFGGSYAEMYYDDSTDESMLVIALGNPASARLDQPVAD